MPGRPLVWGYDHEGYKPTTIAKEIVAKAVGERPVSLAGPQWWLTPAGQTLSQLAGYGAQTGFDWEGLHALLEVLPRGRWTTYGDLAAKVGTAAQPLGQHVAGCSGCTNAWRILDAQGRPTAGNRSVRVERPRQAGHSTRGSETRGNQLC